MSHAWTRCGRNRNVVCPLFACPLFAFVDLGGQRNVIALLAHGPGAAVGTDQMLSLLIEAYGYYKWDENAWSGHARMVGPVELRPPVIPTLITVTDLSDTKSAQVLTGSSDQAAELLGPNVRVARVWLQRVATSRWPLGVLFQRGAGMTDRIAQEVPFLAANREALMTLRDNMPPRFQPKYHYFKGD
jgi:hypothetical protein